MNDFVLNGFFASTAQRKSLCLRPQQQFLSHENQGLSVGARGNRLHDAVN